MQYIQFTFLIFNGFICEFNVIFIYCVTIGKIFFNSPFPDNSEERKKVNQMNFPLSTNAVVSLRCVETNLKEKRKSNNCQPNEIKQEKKDKSE